MKKKIVELIINGKPVRAEVSSRRMLSDFLREDLFLTGTKRGCETGVCGCCSVLVDGEVIKSCLSLAVHVHGHEVTTIEGLAVGGVLHPLQEAFVKHGGLQCGFCTPGFIMTAVAMLNENPNPSEHEIRNGLNGNICRCTGYVGIVKSIQAAAEKLRGN